ncbi:hypothetical protein [Nocardiopsis sp. NPDC055824]
MVGAGEGPRLRRGVGQGPEQGADVVFALLGVGAGEVGQDAVAQVGQVGAGSLLANLGVGGVG